MGSLLPRLLGFCIRRWGLCARAGFVALRVIRIPTLVTASIGGILRTEAMLQGENWNTWNEFVKSISDSIILNGAEGISIIAGVVYFIVQGRKEATKRAHWEAWDAIEQVYSKPSSSLRKQAVEELNQDEVPLQGQDFSGITDFAGINLSRANLQDTHFNKTNLRGARLKFAQLEFAVMEDAKLQNACMEGAYLFGADLRRATLQGANLRNADFEDADLREATFFFADLSGANLKGADLTGANFCGVRNLIPKQIKQAKNWEAATYDEELWHRLLKG